MTLTLFLGLLLMLFILGMPAALSLGVTSFFVSIYQHGVSGIPYSMIAQRMMYGVNSFPLLAIPFFLLAGKIMNIGGITERIFRFAKSLVGHWQGGLGHVNIVASMIFSGMSGSAVADAMGLGTIEIKAMREANYDDDFSAAITAASSTIGPIIPPSIPLIIYGVLAQVSVTKLLIAGLIPGVLMGICIMVLCWIQARKRNYPKGEWAGFGEIWTSFRSAFWPLLAPIIIVGGIWTGIFTPTEAAAVAAVYSIVLATAFYRELSFQEVYIAIKETMRDTSVILLVVAGASLYAWLMVFTRIPMTLAAQMMDLSTNPLVILVILNVFFLIIGLFMETNAAIMVLTPILLPLIKQVGIDPIHFGIVMVLNLMIGLLTPPLGMVMYSVASVAKLSVEKMLHAVAPYYVPLLVALALVTIFPWFTMVLIR